GTRGASGGGHHVIRAVLDTNVVVSGVLRFDAAQSPPSQMLHHWLADDFGVVTSVPLRREIERTLANPYFAARLPHAVGLRWLRSLDELAIPTRVQRS
ncbi:MAG: PIN domain-containing protein, partial [Thermomicrobiales bacterium]